LGTLKAGNNFILGGAMLDENGKMIGSTMVVQFESEGGLNGWLTKEPYLNGKVWEKIEVRPFKVAEVQKKTTFLFFLPKLFNN
jgi:uncharacterized protein YciI